MSQEQSEHSTFFRPRASTSDNNQPKKPKYALLMLHRHDTMQVRIAKLRCEELGYLPIVIERPDYEDDSLYALKSIERLQHCISENKDKEICFALVEANYSYFSLDLKNHPNVSLLTYIIKTIKPDFLFVTTATPECEQNIKNYSILKDVIICDPSYSIIKKMVPAVQGFARKCSAPVNASSYSKVSEVTPNSNNDNNSDNNDNPNYDPWYLGCKVL